jgi:thiamine-phosphate pyrophosphorylase
MQKISKLHYITTSASLAEKACEGGVDWIQLRLKIIPYEDYRTIAKEVKAVCKQYNATFILNDNVQLALEIEADGVHIGKEDMQPEDARAILGRNFIIGCTSNTLDDIITLSKKDIDYIGFGPYRFTTTKEKLSPIVGLEGYQRIFSYLNNAGIATPPVIGIGGIRESDVAELLSTGLYGIAVSGAITNTIEARLMTDTVRKAGDERYRFSQEVY